MKKFLKVTLVILLVMVLFVVVTGCGKKEDNNNNSNIINSNNSNNNEEKNNDTSDNPNNSKTYEVFSKLKNNYIMSLEMTEDGETASMTMAKKGEKTYLDINSSEGKMTIIIKDGKTYLISHDEKAYAVQEGTTGTGIEEEALFTEEDLEKMKTEEYSKGKETIDGTEYEYEEFKDDETGEVERFYFLGKDLKYVKDISDDATEEITKVNNLSTEVDDSLFEIPSGYTEMEM